MSESLVSPAAELYAFVESTEPSLGLGRGAGLEPLRARAAELAESFARARDQIGREIHRTVDETIENLRGLVRQIGDLERTSAAELRERWYRLSANYEAISAHLKGLRLRLPEGTHLLRIKPRNWTRNLFHVTNGVVGVLLYELVFGRTTMLIIGGVILAAFVVMDISRRLFPSLNEWYVGKVFGGISRPADAHETPSSTWYMAGLLAGTIFYPQHAVELGVLVLAFSDPIAAQFGKRWGRAKLYRDKSWVGSAAFVASGIAVGLIFLALVRPALGWPKMLGVAAAAAVAGAAVELFGDHLEDNFTIPLFAGGVATLLLW